MYRLKWGFTLALLLLLVTFTQVLPVYAGGIVPKEDFTITPEEGKYNYPKNFKLRKGKEYIVIGKTEDSYVIKYEISKGIRIDVHVPINKVEYVEETQVEQLEQKRRESIKQFEEEQKAKGLIKIASYWVTKENAELWSNFDNLIKIRKRIIRLQRTKEIDENESAAYYGDIAKLNDKIVSLQQKAASSMEWLENNKATKSSSAREIKQYNSKVTQYNELQGQILDYVSQIKRKQIYQKKKNKKLRYSTDKYETEKSKYMEMFSKVEKNVTDSLSEAQGDEKKFLNFMAKKIQSLSKELMYSIVQVQRHKGMTFVNGVINDKLNTIFMVDTGASYITISKSMAKQLQLNITSKTPRSNVQLADGSVQNVPVITLSSVTIGGLKQNEVGAVVLEDAPNFVPLLGMAFLKHFNWHFEGNNEIVFEKLETSNVQKE